MSLRCLQAQRDISGAYLIAKIEKYQQRRA